MADTVEEEKRKIKEKVQKEIVRLWKDNIFLLKIENLSEMYDVNIAEVEISPLEPWEIADSLLFKILERDKELKMYIEKSPNDVAAFKDKFKKEFEIKNLIEGNSIPNAEFMAQVYTLIKRGDTLSEAILDSMIKRIEMKISNNKRNFKDGIMEAEKQYFYNKIKDEYPKLLTAFIVSILLLLTLLIFLWFMQFGFIYLFSQKRPLVFLGLIFFVMLFFFGMPTVLVVLLWKKLHEALSVFLGTIFGGSLTIIIVFNLLTQLRRIRWEPYIPNHFELRFKSILKYIGTTFKEVLTGETWDEKKAEPSWIFLRAVDVEFLGLIVKYVPFAVDTMIIATFVAYEHPGSLNCSPISTFNCLVGTIIYRGVSKDVIESYPLANGYLALGIVMLILLTWFFYLIALGIHRRLGGGR